MSEPKALAEANLNTLRAPFEPWQVNKLPKPTVKLDDWKALPKSRCRECGGYHATSSTIHLDFVGHAFVTERLLDVDPAWTWEPAGVGEDGQPVLVRDQQGRPAGLWIRLTVLGVTRYGYGSVDPGKAEAVKELIGDALRNAAMRFGVALDLWKKEQPDETPAAAAARRTPSDTPATPGPASPQGARGPAGDGQQGKPEAEAAGQVSGNGRSAAPSLEGERKAIAEALSSMTDSAKEAWLSDVGFARITPSMLRSLPDEKVRSLAESIAEASLL